MIRNKNNTTIEFQVTPSQTNAKKAQHKNTQKNKSPRKTNQLFFFPQTGLYSASLLFLQYIKTESRMRADISSLTIHENGMQNEQLLLLLLQYVKQKAE